MLLEQLIRLYIANWIAYHKIARVCRRFGGHDFDKIRREEHLRLQGRLQR